MLEWGTLPPAMLQGPPRAVRTWAYIPLEPTLRRLSRGVSTTASTVRGLRRVCSSLAVVILLLTVTVSLPFGGRAATEGKQIATPAPAVRATLRPGPPIEGWAASAANGSEPAPIGIADLGAGGGPYGAAIETSALRAAAVVGSVSTYNASMGSSSAAFSIQLNAFLRFVAGGTQYVYWAQDVAEVDSASRQVAFLDNVWNASSEVLTSSALTGNGSVSGSGSSSYYGFAPSCSSITCFALANPGEISVALNVTVGSGAPTVRFEIGGTGGFTTFDTVAFPWATALADTPEFDVNSSLWNGGSCPRCYGDAEWVVGGPGNGYQTAFDGPSNLTLTLTYWNGGDYSAVPSADDYGISTAEGIGHATAAATDAARRTPAVNVSWGGGPLHSLWTPSSTSFVVVTDRTGTPGGTYTVNGSAAPFAGDVLAFAARPGPLTLFVLCGATNYSLGSFTLLPGQVLTLEVGSPPVVFVPEGLPLSDLWAVVLDGAALWGTGNITFGAATGSHDFRIPVVTGYTASPASGNVTVSSGGANVTIVFRASQGGLASEVVGLLETYLPLILVVLVVGGIAAVVVHVSRRHRRYLAAQRPVRPYSGAALATTCPHCGAPGPVGAITCPSCGWRRPPSS